MYTVMFCKTRVDADRFGTCLLSICMCFCAFPCKAVVAPPLMDNPNSIPRSAQCLSYIDYSSASTHLERRIPLSLQLHGSNPQLMLTNCGLDHVTLGHAAQGGDLGACCQAETLPPTAEAAVCFQLHSTSPGYSLLGRTICTLVNHRQDLYFLFTSSPLRLCGPRGMHMDHPRSFGYRPKQIPQH
jgi:hypothetical protein